MEEIYLQGKTLSNYIIYLKGRFLLNSINMSMNQAYKLRKRCLLPSKPSLENLVINISQINRPYNQQVLKRRASSKTPLNGSRYNRLSDNHEIAKSITLKSKFQNNHRDQKPIFNINSIERYIFGPVTAQERKKYVHNIYRGVIYSQIKLKQPSEEYVKSGTAYLSEPTGSSKKFLLLDLDETLIHAQKESGEGSKTSYRFVYRPHLFTFLERMGELFEVYVFTAAQKSYAEAIVQKLNRGKLRIRDILHRQHCYETRKGRYIKDLRIIGNRTLKDIVIIDNLVESFGLQLNNGVPILQFNGAPKDSELLRIIPLMEKLHQSEDVRTLLKETFSLEKVSQINRNDLEIYFSE